MENTVPYINIHTHLPAEDGVVFIYNHPPALPLKGNSISIGIHPWYIKQYDIPATLNLIKKNASQSGVKAIGECGLDKLTEVPMEDQERIFKEEIRIAEEAGKPLIIHCVKAFDDLIRIKKEMKASVPFIVHGYNNNLQIAEQLLKNGFSLSFGKALLQEGSNAQKALMMMESSRFFLETDDAAIPINSIFEKAAELKGTSVEELKQKVYSNFKQLFDHG